MKLIEQYKQIKKDYPYSIIIIKSGVFFVTYEEDATIFEELFNYQLKDKKIGFPVKNIEKIKSQLDKKQISYLIIDNEAQERKEYSKDIYLNLINEIKRKEFNHKMTNILIERIQELINSDYHNYEKIWRFINEL